MKLTMHQRAVWAPVKPVAERALQALGLPVHLTGVLAVQSGWALGTVRRDQPLRSAHDLYRTPEAVLGSVGYRLTSDCAAADSLQASVEAWALRVAEQIKGRPCADDPALAVVALWARTRSPAWWIWWARACAAMARGDVRYRLPYTPLDLHHRVVVATGIGIGATVAEDYRRHLVSLALREWTSLPRLAEEWWPVIGARAWKLEGSPRAQAGEAAEALGRLARGWTPKAGRRAASPPQ